MRRKWLWLLAIGLSAGLAAWLAARSVRLDLAPEVALTHQHEAAFRQQARRLGAGSVKLSVWAAHPDSTAALPGLLLEIDELRDEPLDDSLPRQVRKLARLLAVDVVYPRRYDKVGVEVHFPEEKWWRVRHDGKGPVTAYWASYHLADLR